MSSPQDSGPSISNGPTPSPTDGATIITPLGLLVSSTPLFVVIAIGAHLRLGLNRDLLIGAIRCVAQLSLVGYALGPIIHTNQWFITLPYILAMCTVAAVESVSRPKYAYRGMLPQVFLALGISCTLLVGFGMLLVIPTSPAFDSRYLIPLMGMLLGNSCSSIAVGLSAALEDLSNGASKVEALLAMGASRTEATRHVIRRSVRMALINLVNTLNVAGLVTIPGMMTGQILGGSPPTTAARYQIMIFFLITTATALSCTVTIYLATFTLVGERHSLQLDKVRAKTPSKDVLVGAVGMLKRFGVGVWEGLRRRGGRGRGYDPIDPDQGIDLQPRYDIRSAALESRNTFPPIKPMTTEDQLENPYAFTLTVENLCRYISGRLLHSDLRFTVHSGEVLFITGPSGCGKTKLLRSLAALDEIDSGLIALNNQPMQAFGWPRWRSLVGYVFQQGIAFDDIPGMETPVLLFEVVKRFSSQRERRHGDLQAVGADMGLTPQLLSKRWKELSGGQAQRAQLAVMVALKPSVLLLDEPTSALDMGSTVKVEQVLKGCGAVVVWVSHDPDQPARVDGRIFRMTDQTEGNRPSLDQSVSHVPLRKSYLP